MSRLSVTIVLLALSGVIVYVGVLAQWREVKAARGEIARLQNVHKELLLLEEKRNDLTEKYNAIPEDDLEKIRAIAPSRPRTSSLLVDFEILAQRSNVLVSRIDFPVSKGVNADPLAAGGNIYQFIPLTIRVGGGYDAFRGFLRSLEYNLRLVDITEIDVSSEKTVSGELKGRTYYRP